MKPMFISLAEIDFKTVVEITLGVQTVVLAIASLFLVEWIKSEKKHIANDVLKEIVEKSRQLHPASEYSLAGLIDIAIEIESILEIHTGLIHQLAIAGPVAGQTPNLSKENQLLRDRLQKVMQELMLVHSDEVARRSAIQQLSQTLGDWRSFNKMENVLKIRPDDYDLKEGLRDLKARLPN